MQKPKPDDEVPAIDLEQDRGTRPAERDSDDEREDENQAVPDPS